MSTKNKHLTYDDRLDIEMWLKENKSFKEIARLLKKDPTTISKEIKNHIIFIESGSFGRGFNNCINRKNCPYANSRGASTCNKNTLSKCNSYKEEKCELLNKAPYVCNGCKKKHLCTLTKKMYNAQKAHEEYKIVLKESREGISYTDEEIKNINNIVSPLIINNQSIHHIYINNKNLMICSEKELYKLINLGLLTVKNIDLPRKVKRKITRKRNETNPFKVDKKCRNGRTYKDFLKYLEEHPDAPVVEIDSVEGNKGGKVLLTIYFRTSGFMLAFIRNNNNAQSVIDIFNNICEDIGLDNFKRLFPVILADNGCEFSNPLEIEFCPITGEQRARLFYCDPGNPEQKGACERNHEFIRYFVPKRSTFNDLNQKDINLMMSHINSYKREKLNDKSPLDVFVYIYGEEILNKLNIKRIHPNDIVLNKKIFK